MSTTVTAEVPIQIHHLEDLQEEHIGNLVTVQVRELVTCRECGCTDSQACMDDDGDSCFWVEEDLCSSCAPAEVRDLARMTYMSLHHHPFMSQGDSGNGEVVRECLKCQGPTTVVCILNDGIEIEECQNPDCGFQQSGIPKIGDGMNDEKRERSIT